MEDVGLLYVAHSTPYWCIRLVSPGYKTLPTKHPEIPLIPDLYLEVSNLCITKVDDLTSFGQISLNFKISKSCIGQFLKRKSH